MAVDSTWWRCCSLYLNRWATMTSGRRTTNSGRFVRVICFFPWWKTCKLNVISWSRIFRVLRMVSFIRNIMPRKDATLLNSMMVSLSLSSSSFTFFNFLKNWFAQVNSSTSFGSLIHNPVLYSIKIPIMCWCRSFSNSIHGISCALLKCSLRSSWIHRSISLDTTTFTCPWFEFSDWKLLHFSLLTSDYWIFSDAMGSTLHLRDMNSV